MRGGQGGVSGAGKGACKGWACTYVRVSRAGKGIAERACDGELKE